MGKLSPTKLYAALPCSLHSFAQLSVSFSNSCPASPHHRATLIGARRVYCEPQGANTEPVVWMRPQGVHSCFHNQFQFKVIGRSVVSRFNGFRTISTRLNDLDMERWKSLSTVVTPLKGRSVISVRGSEAGKLLQGLVTNDVDSLLLERQNKDVSHLFRPAMYAGFLAPSGRVISEGHIINSTMGGEPRFLVECDRALGEKLVKHLNRYRLRAQVTIQLEADLRVSSLLTTSDLDMDAIGNDVAWKVDTDAGEHTTAVYYDARHPVMGVRLVHPSNVQVADLVRRAVPVEEEFYHVYRMLGNFPDGAEEVMSEEALPLESNFDELHAISYGKGCYLGQELTSRVHYTGVVRKRLVPVVAAATPTQALELAAIMRSELDLKACAPHGALLPRGVIDALAEATTSSLPQFHCGDALLPLTGGQPTHSKKRQRSAGRIMSSLGHVGMALLRLDRAGSGLMAASGLPPNGPYVAAIWPPIHMPVPK